VKLRVLSGPLSTITDLAATDATTTMLVNVLVSVGQFQRDLQNELTREGLAAAWANGPRPGAARRLPSSAPSTRYGRRSAPARASPPWRERIV